MDFVPKLRSALACRVGKDRFDLWFGDVRLVPDTEKISVVAGSAFLLDRIKRDFQTTIKHVAADLGLENCPLEFVVDADAATAQISSDPAGHTLTGSSICSAPTALCDAPASNDPGSKTKLLRAVSQPARRRRFRTFQSFVEGECNRVARTSAELVVDQPGELSPLFIHGPTGVGKSHLMESIWTLAKTQRRRSRVFYLSAEQFTTYFVDALKGDGLPNFRRKYRQADLLLIDDIQFLAGKKATLVELAYTIDELTREHRQLVLTADRPASQLVSGLGLDVANRLRGGLECAMKPIDHRVMESISRNWAADRNIRIDDGDVHASIAARMQGDARQLSGVLNRLRATSAAMNEPITMRMVNQVLFELVPTQARLIRLQDVRKATCQACGLDPESLQRESRSRAVTQPRMLAMYIARKHTAAGLHEISQFFGRKSHSSAVTANNTVGKWLNSGQKISVNGQHCDVRDIVSQIESLLRTG